MAGDLEALLNGIGVVGAVAALAVGYRFVKILREERAEALRPVYERVARLEKALERHEEEDRRRFDDKEDRGVADARHQAYEAQGEALRRLVDTLERSGGGRKGR